MFTKASILVLAGMALVAFAQGKLNINQNGRNVLHYYALNGDEFKYLS